VKNNMNDNTVPRLDLAPRLKRPLSLWNPLDYLRLLYWVFFFPQAIRWYVEKFGKSEYQEAKGYKAIKELLRRDPVQRKLIVQAFFTLVISSAGISWGISALGLPVNWFEVATGVMLGVAVGVLLGMTVRVAEGVAGDLAGVVAVSVAGGAVFGVAFGMPFNAAFGAALGAALGATFGVVGDVAFGTAFGVTLGAVFGVTLDVLIGAAFISTVIIALYRFFDYILLLLPGNLVWHLGKKKRYRQASRVVFLPLPGLQKKMEKWLTIDWSSGLHNANQLLAYTMQFITVIKGTNATLDRLSGDILLSRIAEILVKPFDWNLIRFGSANLNNQFRQRFLDGLLFFPLGWRRRRKSQFPVEPRFDTPARAACAGFWFWHIKETAKAVEAFDVVKELTHGQELYGIARAISLAQKANDLQSIADWEQEMIWMNTLQHPVLRPGTLETLRTLQATASEARVAHHSQAPLNRSTAIGRAAADLTRLLETGESTCPEPEWPLIKEIVEKWRDIFSKAGGVVGEEVLRQPVLNPYQGYSGLPVTGTTFIGRADIMRRIENRWATTGQPAAIILYGHRRMGKTSILRSLAKRTDSNTLYVYLDMQNVGWVDHTGQLLLDFAEAIHRAAHDAGLQSNPPKEDSYTNLGTGRRDLNALLNKLNPQMTEPKQLVLAIDEFELIETGIEEKRIDAGLLPYLRSINQKYQWLGLIFAGLHTLDEMGRDYQSAFYGQAEYLRVGYLDYNDAVQLITQPHPDFALEYAPGLLEEIYHLTSGQPYLIQRLCWELVTRWNERFLKQGETTPRILTADDLAPVLTPDFFHSAGYYFDGVWSNVTENERILMRIMAQREKGTWTAAELVEATGTKDLQETIDLLHRHDVILEEKGGIRIASELMRRWIAS
jgi:hypothetical protein